jgi:hypothetical protein
MNKRDTSDRAIKMKCGLGPCLLLLFLLLTCSAHAQQKIYKGLRISLFSFEISKKSSGNVSLKCSVANTGRIAVDLLDQAAVQLPLLVVELDSVALPDLLKGHEQHIISAIKKEKITLLPGAIKKKITLKINLEKASEPEHLPEIRPASSFACADVVFDTAYIEKWTDKSLTVHFILRNKGEKMAQLIPQGKSDAAMAVNVYYSSNLKLSPGAILAESIFIKKGKETIDGTLLPGQRLHGELTFSLKNRTRFSPNIIMETDPFQIVPECDKTNNTFGIKVESF